jgi:hypothetical protein
VHAANAIACCKNLAFSAFQVIFVNIAFPPCEEASLPLCLRNGLRSTNCT